MSELTTPDRLFLHRWKSIDFTGWNEAEVREGFVIDLLHTLGYRKGTTFDLELEKPLKLSQPFHRIGRKKVDIDYAPSVRKRYFWIVEAKPGKVKQMDGGDLLQVHLYAVHPEIQARLVVLTNGWQVRVYDALTLSSFDDALLILNQGDDESGFAELTDMVGALNMQRFQRKRMVEVIQGTLEAEVDTRAVDDLAGALHKLIGEARKTADANAKKLWNDSMTQRFAAQRKELREASVEVLFVHMDNAGDHPPGPEQEFVRRVVEASPEERTKLLDLLWMQCWGRPHNVFRVAALKVLVALSKAGIDVPKSPYVTSVTACINELALANISYWDESPICEAVCHLDNVACRVAMKLCIRVGTPHFAELLQAWKDSMTPQENAALSPELDGIVISSANHLHEILWRWFWRASSPDDVWRGIWDLQAIEAALDNMPAKPESERLDFYAARFMGLSRDQLRAGTRNVLRDRPGLGGKDGIDPRVLEFASKSHEDILPDMPRERRAPEGYAPGKTMAEALSALASAFMLRTMVTVGEQIAAGRAAIRPLPTAG